MKRILYFFIIFSLSYAFTLFLQPVYAQTPTPPPSGTTGGVSYVNGGGFDDAIKQCVEQGSSAAECFGKFMSTNVIMNSFNMDLTSLTSDTVYKIQTGLIKPEDMSFYKQLQERSLMGGVSRGIAMLYTNPPADFGYWLADVGSSIGLPKPAYAQGIGFSGLAPLLPVWKAFRNIAYLILAIVMIVIGFMVMLRKKIDPKTVVTVQNALPRIIITLILITFSYAIVGFLIDLMYLVILLAVAAIGSNIHGVAVSDLQAAFTAGGFSEMMRTFGTLSPVGSGGWALPGIITLFFNIPIGIIATIIGVLASGFTNGQGGAVGALSPLLLLLLSLALIITLIRIFFMLFNAYIQIIISLLFGPLQIMMDAIPGSNGFATWLSHLVVNLLTFPIVATLVIVGLSINSNIQGPFWAPPLVPFGGGASQFIRALIGFGIIMTIPSILNGIKESLKVKPALPVTAGGLTAPLGGALGVAGQGLSYIYYGQFLFGEHGPLNKVANVLKRK